MEELLTGLLANFVVLQYKLHSIHTSTRGEDWLCFHNIMNDIYLYFGDDHIDEIKERAEILGETTPSTLKELLRLSTIDELENVPDTLMSKKIVVKDLKHMVKLLKRLCAEYKDDLVTQSMLVEYRGDIEKFIWKLETTEF